MNDGYCQEERGWTIKSIWNLCYIEEDRSDGATGWISNMNVT